MKKINKRAVTCVIDNNSFCYTYVMLKSLFKTNNWIKDDENYDIIIVLNSPILNEYFVKIKKMSSNIIFIDPSKILDNDKMAKAWNNRYQVGVKQYLFNKLMFIYFAQFYETVLLLDGDIIINGDIHELLHNSNKYDLAASLTLYEKYGYNLNEVYNSDNKCVVNKTINTGVVVVNHSFCKKYDFNYFMKFFYDSLTFPTETFIDCGEDDMNYGAMCEEDFINFFIKFHQKDKLKFEILDQKFDMLAHLLKYNINKISDAIIIHYTSCKVWFDDYKELRKLWYFYEEQ